MSNPLKNKKPVRKKGGPLTVGAHIPAITRKAFESHGFPTASILSDWPEIIGTEFAAITAPERLIWPRGDKPDHSDNAHQQMKATHRRMGATLVLRVEGPRSLEIQHIAPQLLERINSYFGYRAVAQLKLLQGPVRHDTVPDAPAREITKVTLDKDIEDEDLRTALAKLGGSID